jgi:hypothetical protein
VPNPIEPTGHPLAEIDEGEGNQLLTRALRHHGLWLALTYVGLILLMARAYA